MVEVALYRVSKRFGGTYAVREVSLVFPDGGFTVLLGPSGSGKTTLLYLVAGIYRPSEGKILFDGKDVTRLRPNERNVGLVFQNYALYPHMRVYDNIAFPLRLRRLPESEIRRRVREIAEKLSIEPLLNRYPAQLSGGQQQRVALARALVKRPRVLLLDEPLSNLDALLRLRIRSELKRLQRDLGITAIYVTHDQSEALAMADKIVVVNNGRVQQEGTPDEVYRRPKNVFVATFIGNPPANVVPVRVEKGPEGVCLVLPGGSYCPGGALARALERYAGRRVLFGFRPEDALLGAPGTGGALLLAGEVYTVEPMGRENIVSLRLNGELVKILAPPTYSPETGRVIHFWVPRNRVMLFDPDTGERIEG